MSEVTPQEIIAEADNPSTKRARLEREGFRDGVRQLVMDFETRAILLDGPSAPSGLGAINLRYYPYTLSPSTSEQGMMNLRKLIRETLNL